MLAPVHYNGYTIRVTSSEDAQGWSATAEATPPGEKPPVEPITTIAQHGDPAEAERIALGLMLDRISGVDFA